MENKPIPMINIWDGIGEDTPDLWVFLEKYMTDYYHSDYIAWIDDIDKFLDNDYEGDFLERNSGFLEMTTEELEEERTRMLEIVFTDAYNNYLETFKNN